MPYPGLLGRWCWDHNQTFHSKTNLTAWLPKVSVSRSVLFFFKLWNRAQNILRVLFLQRPSQQATAPCHQVFMTSALSLFKAHLMNRVYLNSIDSQVWHLKLWASCHYLLSAVTMGVPPTIWWASFNGPRLIPTCSCRLYGSLEQNFIKYFLLWAWLVPWGFKEFGST